MARDYKRKRQSKAPASSPWKFLFSGFGLGLVAAFLMYKNLAPLSTPTPTPINSSTPQSASQTEDEIAAQNLAATQTQKDQTESLPEPGDESDYQFYTLLPDFEVVVSDNDNGESNPTQAQPSAIRSKPTEPGVATAFILQAGSFKSFTDADRRKAELAFKGIESNIQQVVLDQDQIWYRVYVGPSDNRAKLENMRSTLRRDGIDAFFVKVKQ